MPLLPDAQSWLEQSSLLLQARPATTRITTKYTLLTSAKIAKLSRRKPPSSNAPSTSTPASSTPISSTPIPSSSTTDVPGIQATLTLKAYDSVSHTSLKYQTTKAAEVGRLIQIVGRLARPMAGLEDINEDVRMVDEGVEQEVKAEAKPAEGGKGKGKKKKGKK